MIQRVGTLLVVWFCGLAVVADASTLPEYKKSRSELAGTLTSVGSDTMGPLLNRWSQEFRKLNPKVEFQIEAKGSGTAAKA